MHKNDFKSVVYQLFSNYHNLVDGVSVIPNYRTDSGGRYNDDKRLITLSNLIHSMNESVHGNIRLLHDHKGILTVYCKQMNIETKELCRNCWEFFNEYEIEFEY